MDDRSRNMAGNCIGKCLLSTGVIRAATGLGAAAGCAASSRRCVPILGGMIGMGVGMITTAILVFDLKLRSSDTY